MTKWNLNVKNSPQEISESLESTFKSINGIVFNAHPDRKNSIKFKLRKRILYAWYLIYDNTIIVNGKLSKTNPEQGTDVEISFKQHFLWKFVIFIHYLFGLGFLVVIIARESSSALKYLFVAIILALGILLWVKVQKKYEKNVQEYKTLISDILGFK